MLRVILARGKQFCMEFSWDSEIPPYGNDYILSVVYKAPLFFTIYDQNDYD
jgi:hypothetical protein